MRTSRVVPVVLVLALVSACATLSTKDQATATLEAVHTALGSAQDTEITLFESGLIEGLTPERHRAFHRVLVRAFDAEMRLATSLRAWRAGDPVPQGFDEIVSTLDEALGVISDVGPPSLETVITYIRQAIDHLQTLRGVFR